MTRSAGLALVRFLDDETLVEPQAWARAVGFGAGERRGAGCAHTALRPSEVFDHAKDYHGADFFQCTACGEVGRDPVASESLGDRTLNHFLDVLPATPSLYNCTIFLEAPDKDPTEAFPAGDLVSWTAYAAVAITPRAQPRAAIEGAARRLRSSAGLPCLRLRLYRDERLLMVSRWRPCWEVKKSPASGTADKAPTENSPSDGEERIAAKTPIEGTGR